MAAIAPLDLGIRAVVAKSFARIHRRNLICQGILPLTFADETDQDGVAVGDTWRIEGARKAVETGAEAVTALAGESSLQSVTWQHRATGGTREAPCSNLFVMIGAVPNSDWLRGCVDLDEKGFVLSGQLSGASIHDGLSPYATSRSGIYAVGDVRSGSVKRVASAVGEGSVVVQAIHQYLAAS